MTPEPEHVPLENDPKLEGWRQSYPDWRERIPLCNIEIHKEMVKMNLIDAQNSVSATFSQEMMETLFTCWRSLQDGTAAQSWYPVHWHLGLFASGKAKEIQAREDNA